MEFALPVTASRPRELGGFFCPPSGTSRQVSRVKQLRQSVQGFLALVAGSSAGTSVLGTRLVPASIDEVAAALNSHPEV
jgi:hypothetical protein